LLYGYRTSEVNIKAGELPDDSVYQVTKAYHDYDSGIRPPMSATIMPHIFAIPPKPDISNPDSSLYGVGKRMAYKPPLYKKRLRRRFRRFVKKWVRDNLIPIDEDDTLDFEVWLEGTNYPKYRKDQLRESFKNIERQFDEKDTAGFNKYAEVKYFTKEEYYPEYKHHRGIWARADEFKAIAGPFFKKIEDKLFKLPYFIKKVPKDERPNYIYNLIYSNNHKYQTTDFTSYESLFTTDLMDDCEFELYRYMASKNAKARWICQILFSVLAGDNRVVNKFFTLGVHAKRMSGEMNTSLGNGFSNLMFLLFAVFEYKISMSGVVVEGDDGLMGLNKDIPKQYFVDMGLNVKMNTVDNLEEASFCGIIFDPVEQINIRDPRSPLCTTMWVTKKYAAASKKKMLGLVKSKALSLVFEYPGCPILSIFGHKILSLLEGYKMVMIDDSRYNQRLHAKYMIRYNLGEIPIREIGQRTRALMEKLFNIPVSMQHAIEDDIMKMTLNNWDTANVLSIMPDIWIDNYNNYSMIVEARPSEYNRQYRPFTINTNMATLYKPALVKNVKRAVKGVMNFQNFSMSRRFKGRTVQFILKEYNEYLQRRYDALYRLHLNSLPL